MHLHRMRGGRHGSWRARRVALTGFVALAVAVGVVPAQALTAGQGRAGDSSAPTSSDRTAAARASHPVKDPNLPALPDGFGPTPAERRAMERAGAAARSSGNKVAVAALTTPVQQVRALPRGGFELDSNPKPVRTRQHGRWVPIDLRLRPAAGGRLAPAATAYGSVSFSAGGNAPLVSTGYGHATMTVAWPRRLPAPVVKGTTATYREALPGVDLVVAATAAGGFTDTLVVKNRAAAYDPAVKALRLGTTVTGGGLRRAPDGGLSLLDTRGRDVLDAPAAQMWDSNTTLRPAHAARVTPGAKVAADASDAGHPGLAARLAPVGLNTSATSLTLTPDTRLLTGRSTVFPLYVDPTFNWHPYDPAAPHFDEIKQGCPNTSFYDKTDALSDSGRLGVGYNGWSEGDCAAGLEHALYQWKLSSTLYGAHINTATVNATEVYSASCSSSYTVNLHWSGGFGKGTDWSNRPGFNSYSTSASYARAWNPTYCPSNGDVTHGLNVLTPIKADALGHSSTFAVTLKEDSAEDAHNASGFSRFADNPSLEIFYNTVPNTPAVSTMSAVSGAHSAGCDTSAPYPYMGKTIASTPPVLKAKVSDGDGDKLQATFQYWVDGSTTRATVLSGDNLASGSYATASLPSSFTSALTNGKIVDWQAKVTDGEDTTGYSSICHFVAQPTAPDEPTVSSENSLYPDTDNGGAAGAVAGTAGTFDVATSGGASATKFVYSLDVGLDPTVSPPASQTVTATSNAAKVTVTPYAPGPHTLYAYAIDAAGDFSATHPYRFLATGHTPTTCASLTACYNNTGISADATPSQADMDGTGSSYSATDLNNVGWTSGGKVTIDGATFTLPAFGSGQKDNVLAANQTVTYSGSGNALEFLASSSYSNFTDPGAINGQATAPYVPAGSAVTGTYCFTGTTPDGPCAATGTVNYTDGTSTSYALTVPGWTVTDDSIAAVILPHRNNASGQTAGKRRLYAFSVPLDPSRTIASVTLPDVGNKIGNHTPSLHVFSLATRNTTVRTTESNGTNVAAPSGQTWTGAWGSPSEGEDGGMGPFGNQTFRVALRPSVSGSTVRIKLDNALGSSKLSIGHVTVATSSDTVPDPGEPSSVPAGAPTSLTFSGSQSVTVPAGGMIYSDPLPFTVTRNRFLLVSYFLTNSVSSIVWHTAANTGLEYLADPGTGDKTTDTTGTPFTSSKWGGTPVTHLLTDLDVTTAGAPTRGIIGDGEFDTSRPDSLPSGTQIDDVLQRADASTDQNLGEINEGISANQIMSDYADGPLPASGPSLLSRIDRDVLDQPGMNSVLVYEGLEDVLESGRTDVDMETNGYTALVQQLTAWGIGTTVSTLTPCDGYTGGGTSTTSPVNDPCTTTVDQYRSAVNDWLRSYNLGGWWDTPPIFVTDIDTTLATIDTANGEEKLAPGADSWDHLNPKPAGFGAIVGVYDSPHHSWNLDDGDGYTFANDTAPTDTAYAMPDPTVGNDALTLSGGTGWTNDTTRGEVLNLDGTSGYAASGTSALDTTRSYSVSAWVKLSSLPTHNATIAAQDGNQTSPFMLQYNATGGTPGWSFSLSKSDTADAQFWNAYASGVTAGTWTDLVGTYDATTHTAKLYVNGTLAATATGVASWSASGPFTVGRGEYNGAATDFTPGAVSHVQAWNYALTPEEADALNRQLL
ncbi:LamG-like jellyroll fold domain-containing protein [Streptomyces sp. NPDC006335]|uniref:LamG-like jellyroll fold domain-containing protein n=1 Tax=Streptomyces sp. NPDC006335 TaxID=3156895 RepID=UPI0033A4D4FB